MRYHVVIPAAGSGRRFAATVPKQYAPLGGSSVIEHAIACFAADADCSGIAIAIAADDPHWSAVAARLTRGVITAPGGEHRAHSVLNALRVLEPAAGDCDWVMVHDAARPCFTRGDLARLKRELATHEVGGLLAVPLADTLKRGTPPGAETLVESTIDRSGLWRAATPQVFRLALLREALETALAAGRIPTDEAQAMEWAGHRPRLVAGRADNIKVTTPEDLALAAAILSVRKE